MSDIVKYIKLSPPWYNGRERTEVLYSSDYECRHCNGNGFFWEDDEAGERVEVPCRVCNGTRRVSAKITIEWMAGKKEK